MIIYYSWWLGYFYCYWF